jgi:hypothetical protein
VIGMKNRIHSVGGNDLSVTPTEAEILFTVFTEEVTPTTEVVGRMVGPRCRFASTVEVAYPLKPAARHLQGPPSLMLRSVIPEPCLWDLESPFLYRVQIELRQDGECCDRAQFDRGIRTLKTGRDRCTLNGRPLMLRGTTQVPDTHGDGLPLRAAGYNLILAPIEKPLTWFAAYECGLFVLGRLPFTERAAMQARIVGGQVSSFGWLLTKEFLEAKHGRQEFLSRLRQLQLPIGIEIDQPPPDPLPDVDFVVCSEATLAELARINLPRIVMRGSQDNSPAPSAAPQSTWGWIDH